MLAEYKQLYGEGIVDNNLKKVDKNELIRLYVSTNDEKYLSAAIYKFWYILNNKLASNKNNKFVEPEDFYNMYIDSILETCKNKLWENEEHNLYGDSKAPEKSINIIFNSKIINHFHACNRQKRRLSFEKVPLSIYECNDQSSYIHDINYGPGKAGIFNLVVDLFEKKDYYSSYIIDLIVNNNLFDYKGGELFLNRKKLKHHLMNLDEDYLNYFSNYYNIDKEKVRFSYKYFKDVSYERVEKKIENSLISLSHNEGLKDILSFYEEEK